METSTEAKKTPVLSRKAIIIIAVLLAIVLAVIAYMLFGRTKEEDSDRIGYSTNSVVLLDEGAVQSALNSAMKNAELGNIGLWYRNTATSDDGIHFDCFVGNSTANIYDCFLSIYTDPELTDQVFLSDLVPPGSGFEEITLNRALDSGTNLVYVAISQVADDENGEQVMKGQAVHTMEFHVNDPSN